MKKANKILSVDMYAPSKSTRHYNRAELSKVVDYLIIMGYDEHWSTSPKSGSVASLDWVESAVEKTLVDVAKEKVILGVPFYTRIWQEKDNKIVENRAYGMERIEEKLKNHINNKVWLEEDGQHYVEYEKDGLVNKIWIEDDKSLELKTNLVNRYGLSGVAAWKSGFEKESTWKVIKNKLEENDKLVEIKLDNSIIE